MNALAQQFTELSTWLDTHRQLWEQRPFESMPLPWEKTYPQISLYLENVSLETAALLEADILHGANAPALIHDWKNSAETLSQCLPLSQQQTAEAPHFPLHERWKIPLRKRRQIEAFAKIASTPVQKSGHLVDWCAGKGHLGRYLAARQETRLLCLEKSSSLCEAGTILANRAGVDCTMKQIDVMSDSVESLFQPTSNIVALHACGFLNQRLLRLAVKYRSKAVSLAPCCYHKQESDAEYYAPLSSIGLRVDLKLDQQALRLPTTEEVVAGKRKKKIRQQQGLYRMALDLLLREASGIDRYRHLPAVPDGWARISFSEFSQRMADRFELCLPKSWDESTVLKEANARLRRSRKFGLLRRLFRRPIELWLVLDRALYLQENGYQTRMGSFCPRNVTPRNIAIIATLP